MIDLLNVSYKQDEMTINLSVPTDTDNLPYNLADLFMKIIEDSDANNEIVIRQLIDVFGYSEKGGEE